MCLPNFRIDKLCILFAVLLSSCGGAYLKKNNSSSSSPPNVLFIAVDDLNDWVGCMRGHPDTRTPNMDGLASRGVLFTNAHCQAPLCGPSRASLMSGLRPSTSGIYGQISDKDLRPALNRDITFLPQYFSNHGYKTLGVGKLFHNFAPDGVFEVEGGRKGGFGPKPERRFKYDPAWFDKPGGTQTDWGAYPDVDEKMPDYRAAHWAVNKLGENHDRPFFLAVGFVRPHVPWYVPQKWFDRFDQDTLDLPPYLQEDWEDLPEMSKAVHDIPMMPTTEWARENNEWKNIVHAYLASIHFVDHYVGLVLDALEKSAFANNTIVILWSDHGYHIGEKNRFAKHSLWEESTRVPLIISAPGFSKNKSCNQPVELLDLYPTLLDLCNLPENKSNEGHSLVPHLRSPNLRRDFPAITTYGRNNHAIRSKDFRMIVYENGEKEFYDHISDPNEWFNINDESVREDVQGNLLKYLPSQDAPWVKTSAINVSEYFEENMKGN